MKPVTPIYCLINNERCSMENRIIDNLDKLSAQDWFKKLYVELEIDYPKFHKMDGLSKLGFLGVEWIKKQTDLPTETDAIALVFVNKHSSLDADLAHQELIEKATASPAIFVYTLPNIVLGEIAIRNKWYGEQQFFIKNEWPQEWMQKYILTIFERNKANQIIVGYVDYFDSTIDAKLMIINKEQFERMDVLQQMKTIFD